MDAINGTWDLRLALAALLPSAVAIGFLGYHLARTVDRLADRTGLGEALAGAVLLGATTSLSGLIVTITAAVGGQPSLAVSNSFGGIAIQTSFIALADLTYRGDNLEHAAASLPNVLNTFVLIVLLAMVLVAMALPEYSLVGLHPITPLILLVYLYGTHLSRQAGEHPMWMPIATSGTRLDEPAEGAQRRGVPGLLLRFAALAAGVALAGLVVARSGMSIVDETGLSGTLVGTLVTSGTTSLPELVTTLAAVRAGALTLAVAGIVGGNTFDVLFVAAADVAYRDQGIYSALEPVDAFAAAWAIALAGLLGAGLVSRQREGIGYEGVAILAVYALGLATMVLVS